MASILLKLVYLLLVLLLLVVFIYFCTAYIVLYPFLCMPSFCMCVSDAAHTSITYVLISPFMNHFVNTHSHIKKKKSDTCAHTDVRGVRCLEVWSCKWDALISLPSRTSDCHAVSIMAK